MTPSSARYFRSERPRGTARRLVAVPSYESRFVTSLERACNALDVKTVTLVVFKEYLAQEVSAVVVDQEAAEAYRTHLSRALHLLKSKGVEVEQVATNLDDLSAFASIVRGISWQDAALDISTMPRSYILTALRFAEEGIRSVVYTQGMNRREGEDAFAVGIRDVVTLPGFEGSVGHRPTLLAISIGYEGARAYSLFRRFEPTSTLAFLADPGASDVERDQLLRTVRRNNGPLLETDGVLSMALPSYDPARFADLCLEAIEGKSRQLANLQGFPVDVVMSPVGTKPQALGLFSIWLQHPEYQIAYAIPTMRRLGTVDAGSTFWFSRNGE